MSHSFDFEEDKTNKMFLLEGTLTDISIGEDSVNLLEQLKVNSTGQNIVTGLVGALAGNPALIANAAFLESYSGESIEKLICKIDEKIAIGQFSGATLLKVGDKVKAVVSRKGDIHLVHAIQRPQDQLLWLPFETNKGGHAELKKQIKAVMKPFSLFSVIFFIALLFAVPEKLVMGFSFFLVVGAPIFLMVGFWSAHDRQPLTTRAEQIFTTLGFPDVENLDMTDGSYADHHQVCAFSVYYYQCVLDAHREGREVVIDTSSVGPQ